MTAAKKPSHAFQPTPVRSAIRSMRFIVPRRRTRVPSNESFIFSARAVESRISSPMATVICPTPKSAQIPHRSHHTHSIPLFRRDSGSVVHKTQERKKRLGEGKGGWRERERTTHILQHLHLGAHALELLFILALQLAQYGVRVLPA